MGSTQLYNLVGASSAPKPWIGPVPPLETLMGFGATDAVYLFWTIPWIPPVTSPTGSLRIWTATDWPSTVVKVQAITQTWRADKIKDSNSPLPTATGASVTVTVDPAINAAVDINIDAILAPVATGVPWYGVKITTVSGDRIMYGMGTGVDQLKTYVPTVTMAWTDPLNAPTDLMPNLSDPIAGVIGAINDQTPTLSWSGSPVVVKPGDKPSEGGPPPNISNLQFQVQIATNSTFASIVHDSDWFLASTSGAQWNSANDPPGASSPFVPFSATANTIYYWRVRAKDQNNTISNWSGTASFRYRVPNVHSITQPIAPSFYDPSPLVEWVRTSGTENQIAWQLTVTSNAVAGKTYFAASTATTATATSHQIPHGKLKELLNTSLTFELRVWTDGQRAPTIDTPAYHQDVEVTQLIFNGVIPSPNSLTVTPQSNYPYTDVQWTYTSSSPDFFHVYEDGILVASGTPAQFFTGVANTYKIKSMAANRRFHTWYVVAVLSDAGSSNGTPTVTKEVHHNFSWLASLDMVNMVMLGNKEATKDIPGNTSIVEPLSGRPIVVVQGSTTERGRITARISDDILPDRNADQMINQFYAIRDTQGGRAQLFLGNRVLPAFIYDLIHYERTFNEGTVYDIEFSYIETK